MYTGDILAGKVVHSRSRLLARLAALFYSLLKIIGTWVPTMKAAMDIVSGIKMGPPALPLIPISEEAKKRIAARLRTSKLIE